jgi:hypothetical protein
VTLSTTNAAPSASYSVTTPGTGGLVTGIIIASDADNDTLSYGSTTNNTGKGTVTVNTTFGTFSYQPTATAPTYTITTTPTEGTLISTGLGIFAYASTSLGAPDSFAITVSDGHGGTITTPLTFSYRAAGVASAQFRALGQCGQ